MLDKTIPYYDIPMRRTAGSDFPKPDLPVGYNYGPFSEGDELVWAEIEASVGEFDSPEAALEYFRKEYMVFPGEVERRTIFIQSDAGKKVATFTTWWNYTGKLRVPSLHWIAVRPEYQGLGLGKAIVFQGMKHSLEIEGDRDIFLHTQTWSYRAIAVYLKAGFRFMTSGSFGGYKNGFHLAYPILQTKLRGEFLSQYEPLWQEKPSH